MKAVGKAGRRDVARQEDRTRQREPNRKKPALPWAFAAVLFMAVALAFVLRQAEVMSVEKSLAEMEQQIRYYTSMNGSLAKQIEVLKSDEYLEKTAREKLGLVMPGEVQYMPVIGKGKE